jgi:hypothetical protein
MSDCPFLKKEPVKYHYFLAEGDLIVAEIVIASHCDGSANAAATGNQKHM